MPRAKPRPLPTGSASIAYDADFDRARLHPSEREPEGTWRPDQVPEVPIGRRTYGGRRRGGQQLPTLDGSASTSSLLSRVGGRQMKFTQDKALDTLFNGNAALSEANETMKSLKLSLSLSAPTLSSTSTTSTASAAVKVTLPAPGEGKSSKNGGAKMDHSYAIQSQNHLWQYVGRPASNLEKPLTRTDIAQMENKLNAAIAHVRRQSGETRGDSRARMPVPEFEQDWVTMRATVQRMYQGELPKTQLAVAGAIFMQKWTDLVNGEISAQLGTGCVEQGRLLHGLREQNGAIFGSLVGCLKEALGGLDAARGVNAELQAKNAALMAREQTMEAEFATRLKEATNKIKEDNEVAMEERYAELDDLKEQNETTNTTLKTLNGIFNAMRVDTDSVREADLREANNRLQGMCRSRDQQLKNFKQLQVDFRELKKEHEAIERETDDLRAELAATQAELEQRDNLAKELMKREGERLTAVEVAMQNFDPKAADGATPDQTLNELASKATAAQNAAGGAGIVGAQMGGLCMRCQNSLQQQRNLHELDESVGDKLRKIPCAAFRILLPNLMGYRPERTQEWVLRCMRAIVFAKQRSDSIADRNHAVKVRFPEFIYTWFQPYGEFRSMAHRDALMAEADEHRWGLYYGVRELAKTLPEAGIFFDLLDEKHGEDDLCFYLYCMRTLRGVAAGEIKWPKVVTRAGDYQTLVALQEGDAAGDDEEAPAGAGKDPAAMAALAAAAEEVDPDMPERLWVSLETGMYSIEQVMGKSNENERDKLILKLVHQALPAEGRLEGADVPDAAGDAAGGGGEDGPGQRKCVDYALVLSLLMHEYREEQAHRKASIRLMFQSSLAANTSDDVGEEGGGAGGEGAGGKKKPVLDLQQFSAMLSTLNADVTTAKTVRLYRQAYEVGATPGVTLDAFLQAAEQEQFFSSCMRVPSYFGAANIDSLTPSQCVELRWVLYRHIRLFDSFVVSTYSSLNPVQAKQLGLLQQEVDLELNVSTDLHADGRRLLCAYRRVLDFLAGRRLEALEEKGDPSHAYAVTKIERELSMLEHIVQSGSWRMPTPAVLQSMNMDNGIKKLREIMRRLSATRIQRTWRRRIAEHPLPLHMRSKMSADYAVGRGGLHGVSRHRRHLRQLGWAVSCTQQFLQEMWNLMADGTTNHATVQDSTSAEGGRPILVFTHDFFVRRFGTLTLAELELHDFFYAVNYYGAGVNAPSGSPKHGLMRIMHALMQGFDTSNGNSAGKSQTPEYGDAEALFFLLRTLATLGWEIGEKEEGADKAAAAAANDASKTTTVRLFPDSVYADGGVAAAAAAEAAATGEAAAAAGNGEAKRVHIAEAPDDVPGKMPVKAALAAETCKQMLPEKPAKSALKQLAGMSNKDGNVELADFLLMMLNRWVTEVRRRCKSLRTYFIKIDVGEDPGTQRSGGSTARSTASSAGGSRPQTGSSTASTSAQPPAKLLASYHTFSKAVGKIASGRDQSFLVRLYMDAMRAAKTSALSDVDALVTVCRQSGLVSWKQHCPEVQCRVDPANLACMLRHCWAPFAETAEMTVARIKQIKAADGVENRLKSLTPEVIGDLDALMHGLDSGVKAVSNNELARTAGRRQVEDVWAIFIQLCADVAMAAAAAGLGRKLIDHEQLELERRLMTEAEDERTKKAKEAEENGKKPDTSRQLPASRRSSLAILQQAM